MATVSLQVVNVNGLNRQREEIKVIGTSADWKDLAGWMLEQERYFEKNQIESDDEKIEHVIMNIDVRFLSPNAQ